MSIIKEDSLFKNVGHILLSELFGKREHFVNFRMTLSNYVVGMNDKQQTLSQEDNEEMNKFLRVLNGKMDSILNESWQLFSYELAEFVIQSEDSEINSK